VAEGRRGEGVGAVASVHSGLFNNGGGRIAEVFLTQINRLQRVLRHHFALLFFFFLLLRCTGASAGLTPSFYSPSPREAHKRRLPYASSARHFLSVSTRSLSDTKLVAFPSARCSTEMISPISGPLIFPAPAQTQTQIRTQTRHANSTIPMYHAPVSERRTGWNSPLPLRPVALPNALIHFLNAVLCSAGSPDPSGSSPAS